jgi:hypothetical protein
MAGGQPVRASHVASASAIVDQRSASELGHYADLKDHPRSMLAPAAFAPHSRLTSHGSAHGGPEEIAPPPQPSRPSHGSGGPRPASPERPKREEPPSRMAKISAPKNAVPIADSATFKQPQMPVAPPPKREDDRRARVKSSFWGFARSGARCVGRLTRASSSPLAHRAQRRWSRASAAASLWRPTYRGRRHRPHPGRL